MLHHQEDLAAETARMAQEALPPEAFELLQRYWGYSEFRPLQQRAISAVLNQDDSVVILSTGGGKSLCYQLPALLMEGTAIVVSPLISLMKDQVDGLTANGIAAGFINSSLAPAERMRMAHEVSEGKLKLLYVAPERLCLPQTIEFLKRCQISFFAIDEAHCISHWGHDFRPDYRQLAQLKTHFPDLGIHAFTATATRQVRSDIAKELHLKQHVEYVGSFDRPNLHYVVKPREKILTQVLSVVERNAKSSGIIYCISRRKTEELSHDLNLKGIRARHYHAGLSDVERKQTQEDFQEQRVDVIVATVAFGMGIDKSDVRYVIHVEAPRSLENYQQESGRAGRDGLPAECYLFYGPGDFITWKRMQSDLPPDALALAVASLNKIEDFCQGTTCRHKALVEHFDQEYDGDYCGACDVCLDQQELHPDALIISQKILSCVHRLQERFGAMYTVTVLHGSKEQRILELGHDKLSTYGLLKDFSQTVIRQWIEQLIQQKFLARAGEFHQLAITPEGRNLLKGMVTPKLLTPTKKAGKSKTDKTKNQETTKLLAELLDQPEQQLFERLRSLRLDLAKLKKFAPFMIFPDSTLVEMSLRKPHSAANFAKITGVGQKKLQDYGEAFLTLIQQFCSEHKLEESMHKHLAHAESTSSSGSKNVSSSNVLRALELFRSGLSIDDVSQRIGLAHSTVADYLARLVEEKLITDISPWVTAELQAQIIESVDDNWDGKLKPIFLKLEEKIPYDIIKLTLAFAKANSA